MNILRLSTLSLILVVAVFAVGYTNPAFADKPGDGGHNHGDDPGGFTYTIDLIGPPSLRGAFEFDGTGGSATLDRGALKITGAVTMTRPGDATGCNENCTADDVDQLACIVWNDVFNVCGLLGTVGMPTNLDTFTVEIGDWSVSNSSEKQFISFGFEIAATLSPPSSRPLSAFLQLSRACDPVAQCRANIPTAVTAPEGISFLMTDASIHLRGQRGVTQQADCHSDTDLLAASGSRVVITVTD